MGILEAIILGIIQGLTEFLPVSSSGHLELGKAILGSKQIPEESLLFTVVVHTATVLSTLFIFHKDVIEIIKGVFKFKWNEEVKFVLMIIVSMMPVLIVGLFFEERVEKLFDENVLLVGIMLLVTGALLLVTLWAKKQDKDLTYGKALIIGIAQAIAVMPGISRSGSTIATGLLLGIDKSKIARFSFLMVIPPIMGAMLLKIKDMTEAESALQVDVLPLVAGFAAAFLTGLLACKWMISIVKKGKIQYFAYYCFLVGVIAIIASCI